MKCLVWECGEPARHFMMKRVGVMMTGNPVLEIIATSAADAKAAQAGGADRIELVCAMSEGGLTPSFGIIEQVVASVAIPVFVMIRPHSRSFTYDRDDIRAMRRDIRAARSLGAAGIVIGALDRNGEMDEEPLKEWIAEAGGMEITFHRAFDESADLARTLGAIARYPEIRRVLTSGGRKPASEAISELKELAALGNSLNVGILAGGGVTLEAINPLVTQCGIREVHLGSAVRREGSFQQPIDPVLVDKAKQTMLQSVRDQNR